MNTINRAAKAKVMVTEPCFACGRKLGSNPKMAITEDHAQQVYVGSECYRHIGVDGWQPPLGGPRLYRLPEHATK